MLLMEFEDSFSELEICLDILENDLYQARFRLQEAKRRMKKLYEESQKEVKGD